jgi:NADH-quinone oxidoreductase subunit J
MNFSIGILDYLLVAGLVIAAIGAVVSIRLIRSVIGLAVASVLLTVMMFRLGSPLAAVFELSVCAGLIPAIFISTIGLTGRTAPEEMPGLRREKLKRYWLLPVLLVIAGLALTRVGIPVKDEIPVNDGAKVRNVLWNERQVDLIGQVVVLLGGALGVVVLVKERKEPKNES